MQPFQTQMPYEAGYFLPTGMHFLVALIAGVILAVAFQLVLTHLSLAAGVTAIGSLEEGAGEKKRARVGGPTLAQKARRVTHGLGIWTLVTATIALFFATWLAVALSRSGSYFVGAVLGLAIWGLFYVAMMTLELRLASSLVGSMIGIAATGLRSVYEATTAIFGKSTEARVADAAAEIAEKVREEFFGDMEGEEIRTRIGDYLDKLQAPKFSAQEIRNELERLLNDMELRAVTSSEGPMLDRETMFAALSTRSGMTRERAQSAAQELQDVFSKVREEMRSGKDMPSKVADASMRAAGMSSEEARAFRERVENYLRSTNKEALNPEAIKRELEWLVKDPRGGAEALRARLAQIDEDTVASILAARGDMSHEEARHLVDRVANVARGLLSESEAGAESALESARQKLRQYVERLNLPQLDYEGIGHDMMRLFSDPKAGAEALLQRLRSIDRNTLKTVLASRRNISEEDAERIVRRIEEARDTVYRRAEQMKEEAERRTEEVRQEAVHQAEEARKTAAVAAWWTFGTAVASGVAAAIGGMVAAGYVR